MSKIRIFRQRVKHIEPKQFAAIAKDLKIKGKPVETEDALAVHADGRMLAYAQPGARFAGLLFYTDQTESRGAVAKKLPETKRAQDWTKKFLDQHDLLPRPSKEMETQTSIEFKARKPEAVVFDGRERKTVSTVMDVAGAVTVDGMPVTGPRGKLRSMFKSGETPIAIHRGIWESLDTFEERDAISEDEAVNTVMSRLKDRGEKRQLHRLVTARRAYWAKEYEGGPDLLEPYYFVEVEFEDREAKKQGISQGPRQVLLVPASR